MPARRGAVQRDLRPNTDWLDKVVEATSGPSLDVYFKENGIGPLGMTRHRICNERQQKVKFGVDAPAWRWRNWILV